jgi:hypothetical protein
MSALPRVPEIPREVPGFEPRCVEFEPVGLKALQPIGSPAPGNRIYAGPAAAGAAAATPEATFTLGYEDHNQAMAERQN